MLQKHGGNIKEAADKYKINAEKIIDFSSNINPLGISPCLKKTLKRKLNCLLQYPDPQCRGARKELSSYWGISPKSFLIGNGSNELIHMIPRALGAPQALTYQPAFSEYGISLKASGAKQYLLFADKKDGFSIDIGRVIPYLPKVGLIILCNPNNPTGNLIKREPLLELAEKCEKKKVHLLIDEVFMDFVDKESGYSLLLESAKRRHLLILRSFTKIFSLPGIRAGYLVGHKDTIRKIASYQPSWSVNSLAQEVIASCLKDKGFIKKTKIYLTRESEFLFNGLNQINGITPYPPAANFILCKIEREDADSARLFLRLLKSGILIRDCSNFKGLDNKFFRVAVKKRGENLLLLNKLKRAFK